MTGRPTRVIGPWESAGEVGSDMETSGSDGGEPRRGERLRRISEQIEDWEEEDPDEVDEVPIKAGVLDHPGAFAVEPVGEEDREHEEANDDVNRMETGEEEVGAGPHIPPGDHRRQTKPGEGVVEPRGMAAVAPCPFRRQRHDLVGDDRQIERLLTGVGQHFLHFLESAAGRLLLR